MTEQPTTTTTQKKFIRQRTLSTEYNIYLDSEVKSSEEYTELFDTLVNAGVNDEINIYINNDGGLIDTAIEIVNMIKDCNGEVTTILNGSGHSAASIIFMAGHKKIVKNHSYMLCHFYSAGLYGKGQELRESSKFLDKHLKKWNSEIYKGFLTTAELEKMFNGQDFWFDSTEIKKRLKIK